MLVSDEDVEIKNKRIKKEITKIKKIFKALEDNEKMKLADKLIEHAAYLAIELDDLKKYNIENGIKEKYKNGENQYGYKESVENKTYKDYIKQYTTIIKQLNDMLPDNKKADLDDAFDNFGCDE